MVRYHKVKTLPQITLNSLLHLNKICLLVWLVVLKRYIVAVFFASDYKFLVANNYQKEVWMLNDKKKKKSHVVVSCLFLIPKNLGSSDHFISHDYKIFWNF